MAKEKEIWVIESPITMVEGEEVAYSIDWLGASKLETAVVKVYKNGGDKTSDIMISGDSNVISGNVLTCKKITALEDDGGSRYVLVAQCAVDNNTEIRKCLIQIVKPGDEG